MSTSADHSSSIYLNTELALSQIGDAHAMQGMLAMLEESLSRDVPLIAKLLAANDVVGANRLLHPLKGFIPIFCNESLCTHVSRVEELSKAGAQTNAAELAQAYAGLKPELELLLSEVADYMNTHGAAY